MADIVRKPHQETAQNSIAQRNATEGSSRTMRVARTSWSKIENTHVALALLR